MLTDEQDMRSYSREQRAVLRKAYGKCAGCAWPAITICTRDHCPQGIAYVWKLRREWMAELERTCHTPEDWAAAGEALLRKAADAAKKL